VLWLLGTDDVLVVTRVPVQTFDDPLPEQLQLFTPLTLQEQLRPVHDQGLLVVVVTL
jgi:hypothetical protein